MEIWVLTQLHGSIGAFAIGVITDKLRSFFASCFCATRISFDSLRQLTYNRFMILAIVFATSLLAPKPSFTMILVAGNEHPIVDLSDLDAEPSDNIREKIQEFVHRFDRKKQSYFFIDGGNIAKPTPKTIDPIVFALGKTFSPGKIISSDIIQDGKKVRMTGLQSASSGINTTNLYVYRQDRVNAAGFSNTMMGEKPQALFLSALGSLLLVNEQDRPEYQDYYPNQIAISRTSVDDTRDWLKINAKKFKPSIVLCASGEPQSADKTLFAFPPAGVIYSYRVTFDMQWTAEHVDTVQLK